MRKTTRLPKTVNGFLLARWQSIKTQEGNVEAAMKLRSTNKREVEKEVGPKRRVTISTVEKEVGPKRRVTISTAAGTETSRYMVRLQPECSEGNSKTIALSVELRNDSAIVW